MLTALAVHGFTARDRLPVSFVLQPGTVRQAIQLAAALRSGHRDAAVRPVLADADAERVLGPGSGW